MIQTGYILNTNLESYRYTNIWVNGKRSVNRVNWKRQIQAVQKSRTFLDALWDAFQVPVFVIVGSGRRLHGGRLLSVLIGADSELWKSSITHIPCYSVLTNINYKISCWKKTTRLAESYIVSYGLRLIRENSLPKLIPQSVKESNLPHAGH
jgi:hypothetical protein